MYLLPLAVELKIYSTAIRSTFLLPLAVEFEIGSRKKIGSRKNTDRGQVGVKDGHKLDKNAEIEVEYGQSMWTTEVKM